MDILSDHQQLRPGYTGYLTQKWLSNLCMSRTYGDATTTSFQKRWHTLLSSSTLKADKEALPPLTKFPTTNSNEPNLVLANRKRTRERYMAGKRYQLFSEGTRKTIRIEM